MMAAFFTVQAKAGVVSSGFFSSALASSVLGGSALSDVPATFAQAIDPSASRSSAIVGLSSVMPFTVAARPITSTDP
ncbi:unknown [Sutterella sp. CAG:351]|nr:unknown [Sutterella sp. CAG:351]